MKIKVLIVHVTAGETFFDNKLFLVANNVDTQLVIPGFLDVHRVVPILKHVITVSIK